VRWHSTLLRLPGSHAREHVRDPLCLQIIGIVIPEPDRVMYRSDAARYPSLPRPRHRVLRYISEACVALWRDILPYVTAIKSGQGWPSAACGDYVIGWDLHNCPCAAEIGTISHPAELKLPNCLFFQPRRGTSPRGLRRNILRRYAPIFSRAPALPVAFIVRNRHFSGGWSSGLGRDQRKSLSAFLHVLVRAQW